MSDFSPGGYPPPPPPPGYGPAPAARRRNPAAWIAIAAAAVLVVTAGAGAFFLLNRDEPAVTPVAVRIALEPAADPGDDPFLAEVEVREVAAFPDSVLAVADTTVAAMATDPASGTLTTAGTTAALYGGRPDGTGLYGGSGDQAVCDIDQLATFLEDNPDKAAAWASVQGITPDGIREFLTGLTPVALLVDTAVTNHGFSGGVATPRQSVLQAGTAVLVDDTGLPVVRCACGNPLTAPQVTNFPGADFYGNRWEGFDPARTVSVTRGSAVTAFSLVDLETGASFERPVGVPTETATTEPSPAPAPEGPRTLVAVGGIAFGDPTAAGQVYASTNGIDWTIVLDTPGPSAGVAVGDGLTVVVGSDQAGGGTVRTTRDGVTWTDQVTVPDPLQQVGFGAGLWLAVGTTAGGTEAVIYTSPDATTWTRTSTPTGISAAGRVSIGSIAFGQERWQISYGAFAGGGGRGFAPLGVSASTDNGQTWQPVVPAGDVPGGLAENPVAMDLAFGEQWAMVGYDQGDVTADTGNSAAQSGTSADGTTWSVQQTQPVDTYLDTLAWSGDGEWFALGALKSGFTGAAGDNAVYSSTDLVTWNRLGNPAGTVADIAVSRWPALTAPAAPAPSAAPTGEAPAPVAGACVDGGLQFTLSRETSFPTCEAMIAQWRSFTATGGTETRQGDWICGPAGSLQAGQCALSDTDIVFTVGPATPGTAPPPAPAAPAAPAGAVPGDLGLSVPMTKPACDGTGIVLLFASVTPSAYAQEIQQALNEFPNSSYLRTDQACPSLTQATAAGDPIYAVYRVAGPTTASVCAGVAAAGGSAYGKWLDNSTPPEARVDC